MSEPRYKLDTIGGNCPVQAEGSIDGTPFYFRARGSHWTFSVGRDVFDPDYHVQVKYGPDARPFAAGWIDEDEARDIVDACVSEYLLSRAKLHTGIGDKPYVEAAHED